MSSPKQDSTASMASPLDLHLEDVRVCLPGRSEPLFTLRSLRLPYGSQVLLRGPSGKGKTTLLHILSGQFLPEGGTVRMGDFDFRAMTGDARARMRRRHFGIVFQRFNLLGHLNPLENVLLAGPSGAGLSLGAAREALERLGLNPSARRTSASHSPGEQQRIAVARVLAARPDIVLADEPTSSLDGRNAEEVMEALLEASGGRTLVVVSHDDRILPRFRDIRDFETLIGT